MEDTESEFDKQESCVMSNTIRVDIVITDRGVELRPPGSDSLSYRFHNIANGEEAAHIVYCGTDIWLTSIQVTVKEYEMLKCIYPARPSYSL